MIAHAGPLGKLRTRLVYFSEPLYSHNDFSVSPNSIVPVIFCYPIVLLILFTAHMSVYNASLSVLLVMMSNDGAVWGNCF